METYIYIYFVSNDNDDDNGDGDAGEWIWILLYLTCCRYELCCEDKDRDRGMVWGLVGLRDLLGFKMRWKRVVGRGKGNIFRDEMKR